MEWICAHQKCKESSAKTLWYNVLRVRKKLGFDSKKIPRTHTWVPSVKKAFDVDQKETTRKNIASAIVVYLRALEAPKRLLNEWVDYMSELSRQVDIIYARGNKTDRQKKNWISKKDVDRFVREKVRNADRLEIWKKSNWTDKDRRIAQDALMLTMHNTNPPRLEFSELIYTEEPTVDDTQNYLIKIRRKGWHVIVHKGKTAKGQTIKLSASTNRLLNKMRRHLKHNEPVFTSRNGSALTRNAYGKRLAQLFQSRFGKRVTASMLRAIFVTDRYKGLPVLNDIAQTAHNMMHNVRTHLTKYRKNES